MSLGKNISKYRKQNKMSQEILAEKLNVSRQSVNLWETNQTTPSIEKLIRLSKLFNISLDELSDGVVDGNTANKSTVKNLIATASTKYSVNVLEETINFIFKKFKNRSIITSVFLLWTLLIFLFDGFKQNDIAAIIIVILIGVILFQYFKTKNRVLNDAKQDLIIDKNKIFLYEFFEKECKVKISSDQTNSETVIKYTNFKQILETENYYLLVYINKYYTVDKENIVGDVRLLRNIFKNKGPLVVSPSDKIENTNTEISFGKAKILKSLSILVFILNFFTLPLALIILAIYDSSVNDYSTMASVENTWIFLLVLPIPLLSIYLGFRMKKFGLGGSKNTTIGFIMTVLVLLFSSFSLIFGFMYSHDYTYVDDIEDKIHFALPDKGKITTQEWSNGLSNDGIEMRYNSDVIFTDSSELSLLNSSIKTSEKWTSAIQTENIGMLCILCEFEISNYDYFMIFNVTTYQYNLLPNVSGTYEIVFLAYDTEEGKLKISEYSIEIVNE